MWQRKLTNTYILILSGVFFLLKVKKNLNCIRNANEKNKFCVFHKKNWCLKLLFKNYT